MTADYEWLAPQHAKYLRDRAVNPAVARARGYQSVDAAGAEAEGGFKGAQRRAGLLIPVWAVDGEVAYHQLRFDAPRLDPKRNKLRKFENLRGEPTEIDVPPPVRGRVIDAREELWITEGIPKADAAVSAGLCCIAVSGVWNWQKDGELKTAWQAIPLKGRRVFICFDSDVMTKTQQNVARALDQLDQTLTAQGAKVLRVVLPGGSDKVGLDDFLAAHPVEQLRALAAQTAPGTVICAVSTGPTTATPSGW